MRIGKGSLVCSTTLALLAASGSSLAQSPALEEVVVTAQKREQKLKDVPLSVAVLQPEFIADNKIRDFADLAQFTPGFVSSPNYGFILYSSIRGISSNEFGFATDPSIAIYVDGVYQGLSGSQVNSFYDLDRVEILNGPQATLFGRSSIAGAINVINNRPGKDLEGYLTLGVGEHSRYAADGAINVPLSDDLFARFSGKFEDQDGFIANRAGGSDLSPTEIAAGRIQLRYDPGTDLLLDMKLNYEDRKQSGNIYQSLDLADFEVNVNPGGRGNYANYEIFDAVVELNYDLRPDLLLTANTSYRIVENEYQEKFDGLPQIVGGPYFQGQEDKLFQQELRLAYSTDSGLAVIGGLSWSQLDREAFIGEWVDSILAYTLTLDIPSVPTDFSRALLERADYEGTFEDMSAYVDATLPLSDRMSVTGGVRYNYNKKEYSQFVHDPVTVPENNGLPVFYLWGFFTSAPISGEESWDDVSFRAALNYDLTPDITGYLAFNQGWKAGGFRTLQLDNPPPLYTYTSASDASAFGSRLSAIDPESSDSYEVGLKGSAFGWLGFSTAAFAFDYSGLQRIRIVNAQTFVENIDADGVGLEADLRASAGHNLDLFLNFAWVDTEIKKDPAVAGNIGKALNLSPNFNGSVGAAFTSDPITALGSGTLFAAATGSRRESYRNDDQMEDNVPAYWIVNFNAGWESKDNKYRLNVYLNNAFDEFSFGRYLPPNNLLSPLGSRSVIGRPRQLGADFTVRF